MEKATHKSDNCMVFDRIMARCKHEFCLVGNVLWSPAYFREICVKIIAQKTTCNSTTYIHHDIGYDRLEFVFLARYGRCCRIYQNHVLSRRSRICQPAGTILFILKYGITSHCHDRLLVLDSKDDKKIYFAGTNPAKRGSRNTIYRSTIFCLCGNACQLIL